MSGHRKPGIRIVSVGGNTNRVALRHARLQLAGYEVWSTTDLSWALKFIHHERCGVLLLHYSLPEQWVKSLITAFRKSCPEGRVIAITDRINHLVGDVDVIVFESDGTTALLKAISREETDSAA